MHSNPVQDHEILAQQKWTDREAAVMRNNTQGLPGYGNSGTLLLTLLTGHICHYHEPRLTRVIIHNLETMLDYEDSDSDDNKQRSNSVLQETTSRSKTKPRKKTEKKREDATSPPLPGFGNPEFEQLNPQSGNCHRKYGQNHHAFL